MLAAGMENSDYHQVRIREKPLSHGGIGCGGQTAQVLRLCETAKVFGANSSQIDYFFLSEELLA